MSSVLTAPSCCCLTECRLWGGKAGSGETSLEKAAVVPLASGTIGLEQRGGWKWSDLDVL